MHYCWWTKSSNVSNFMTFNSRGLDVVSIRQLVVLLRLLSRQGRTIICTVHQPSASLFALFDRIYVLARGMCCYQVSKTELFRSVSLFCPHIGTARKISLVCLFSATDRRMIFLTFFLILASCNLCMQVGSNNICLKIFKTYLFL